MDNVLPYYPDASVALLIAAAVLIIVALKGK